MQMKSCTRGWTLVLEKVVSVPRGGEAEEIAARTYAATPAFSFTPYCGRAGTSLPAGPVAEIYRTVTLHARTSPLLKKAEEKLQLRAERRRCAHSAASCRAAAPLRSKPENAKILDSGEGRRSGRNPGRK